MYENKQFAISLKASEDLSTVQYYLVEMSEDDQVKRTSAANNKAAGVLQNKPESGQHAKVCPMGITNIRVGVACSYGDKLGVADSGYSTIITSGQSTIGWVLHGCSSGGIATGMVNFSNAIGVMSM